MNSSDRKKDIAVVGISGIFPKSKDLSAFWENLVDGKELIHFYDPHELDSEMSQIPHFVPAQSFVSSAGSFDYKFFGYTREEAMIMDPQIRIMHEQVYAALENAGYSGLLLQNSIGLYLSASDNLNWRLFELMNTNSKVPKFIAQKLSNKEFISTLISYKLGLTGPSFFLDSACSSSLSNVHLACRGLLLKECNMAVAGGVCIHSGETKGYVHEKDLIFSEDGHCRAFDEKSSGTVDGEGAGVVVLKRFADAVRDNDYIYAVVRGTAVNNDGKRKVGYTAPSVKGQSDCIKMALKVAGVSPEEVSYVEAHGTGTRLGDPIEIEALNEAFNYNNHHKCAIGSVKTNMGHLDAAAGIAGFIKTCLVLDSRVIPPSLHFEQPNPEINFDKGPFYVNVKQQEWTAENQFVAGVSSFGIGGTNCHAILEEYRHEAAPNQQKPFNLLLLSAKTEPALANYKLKIVDYLEKKADLNLDRLSYSINANAQEFPFRGFVVFEDGKKAVELLKGSGNNFPAASRKNNVVFMFPGQGTQYYKMGYDLYCHIPAFKRIMDVGFEILSGLSGTDFKRIIGYAEQAAEDPTLINNTQYTQPLLFLMEYALAKTLLDCGLRPTCMIGHSLGEYVAACVANVFSFEDGLKIIYTRSALMSQLPSGAMIAVKADEHEVSPIMAGKLSTAAVNIPNTVVLSGMHEYVEALAENLKAKNVPHSILRTSHAFHSYMMEGILGDFEAALRQVNFAEPEIPIVSNLTGTFIGKNEFSPSYWSKHLRNTVQFKNGLEQLNKKWSPEECIFIEVGPGRTLLNFLKAVAPKLNLTVSAVSSAEEGSNDYKHFLNVLGALWSAGQKIDLSSLYPEGMQKIPIPTYAFDVTQLPARVDPLKFLQQGMAQNLDLSALIEQSNAAALFESEPGETTREEKTSNNHRIGLTTEYVAPANPVQEKVCAIWQSYLGYDRIGIEDDFFELGGDSLKAMSILNVVNKDFDCEIPIQDLFGNPTVKNMSDKIELTERLKKVTQHVSHKNKLKI